MMKILSADYLHDLSYETEVDGKRETLVNYYDWSYVAGDKIHTVYYHFDGSSYMRAYDYTRARVVTQQELQRMFKRYTNLYERGATEAETFGEYLVERNVITEARKDWTDKCVYLAQQSEASITRNEYFYCETMGKGSKYFTAGQTYLITQYGCGNKGKAEAEYFTNAYTLYAQTLKLKNVDAAPARTEVIASIVYIENHWYWETVKIASEYAYLTRRMENDYLVIVIGNLNNANDRFDDRDVSCYERAEK